MQTNTVNNQELNTYTVWVGGVPDVENVDLTKAFTVLQEWVNLGYDDVTLEICVKGE